MARQLMTVDEVVPFLDLKDDTEDDLISLLIDAATAYIEQYCACTFESTGVSYSETYDGDGEVDIYLHHRPIIAVSSLVITDSADVADTIPATDYKIYATIGKIVLTEGDTFLTGDLNVAVTYTAGETTLPPDVKLAFIKLLRWHKRKWTDNRDGVSSVSVGEQVINYEADVPAEIRKLLDPHRVLCFG